MSEKFEKNQILYGDNLKFLRNKDYFPSNYVDLIYLDPPFNSKKAYNVIYDKDKSKAQAKAFEDTWTWSQATQETYDNLMEGDRASAQVKKTIKSFHDMLGDNNMMAYLVMMTPRLIELKRVLRETGSIYLHCDPTASHYLKIIMDGIFGKENFQNEIVWFYPGTPGRPKTYYPKKHDTLFYYSKSDDWYFDDKDIRVDIKEESKERYKYERKLGGHSYIGGKSSKTGKIPEDVWRIPAVKGNSKEAVNYPTQKPEDLLERIIKASCPEDGIVLDPFCGCGTTLITAEKLERKWFGIDITYLAIDVLKQRIEKDFNSVEDVDFEVKGEPEGMAGAKNMSENNKGEFQKWIISKIGGTPHEKLSGDEGIDGFLFFKDGGEDKITIIQETVSKSVSPNKVRDFKGTMEREDAPIGIFVTFKEPTKGMKEEANKMGKYEDSFGNKYPRLQFLTVQEILNGGKPDLPNIRRHISKREVEEEWEGEQTTLK